MQVETLNLSWELYSVRLLIAEFWKKKQTCEVQTKSVGKGLPLLGKIMYLRASHLWDRGFFPVESWDLAHTFHPSGTWPYCSLHSFLELWRWWITILGADKNVKCRINFPNVMHTSWGDAGSRLHSLVRKIQGKGLVCPHVVSACPKRSYVYQMLINTPTGLTNCIHPPRKTLPSLVYPSWGTLLRRGSCYPAAPQPRRWAITASLSIWAKATEKHLRHFPLGQE